VVAAWVYAPEPTIYWQVRDWLAGAVPGWLVAPQLSSAAQVVACQERSCGLERVAL